VFLCKSLLLLVQKRSSVDKIRPALLNALIGLVMTLINVYTTQGGHWSITAVVTAAVTAFITLVTVTLSVLYVLWTKPA
jgi:drug/metabolite transporter (DMT)-like permease